MPSGAKKRKAAKKKKQQAAHQITISTKSNHGNGDDSINSPISNDNENDHHPFVIKEESLKEAFGFNEEDTIKIEKNLRPEEAIKIIDSNTEQNKASSSSSSSDEESQELDKRDDKEAGNYAILATGNATFSGPNANAIIENTTQVQSTTLVQPNSIEQIRTENTSERASVISVVDTLISREDEENADKNVFTYDENTQPSLGGIKESEVTISSHEKEAPLRSPHGIERRTSWLSCCGLFDVITESRI